MKLTKYQHACFTLEKDGKILVVDPGVFSTDFVVPENVVGVVISHEHSDHFDPNQLAVIYDKNPDSILISHAAVTEKMPDHSSRTVSAGDTLTVGPFALEFFGGDHLQSFPFSPVFPNLGVLINESVYYAGDSFVTPSKPVHTLLLPISGSWMKASMAYKYFMGVQPQILIPTHDAILSDVGKQQIDKHIPGWTDEFDYTYIRPSEPIEVDG